MAFFEPHTRAFPVLGDEDEARAPARIAAIVRALIGALRTERQSVRLVTLHGLRKLAFSMECS